MEITNTGNTELAAECLALVTGIFPTKPPTNTEINRALKILGKAESAINDFLSAENPSQYEYEPPPPQGELLQSLATDAGKEEWFNVDLPTDTLPAWIIKVNEVRAYCEEKWPKYEEKALTPAYYDLAEDELGDIWEIVRSVDSADTMINEMRSHTLSPSQVEAVSKNYPNYYAAFVEILDDRLIEFALKKDFLLSIPQEDVIRTLKKLGEDDAVIPAQPENQQKPSGGPAKNVAANTPISSAIEARQQGLSK